METSTRVGNIRLNKFFMNLANSDDLRSCGRVEMKNKSVGGGKSTFPIACRESFNFRDTLSPEVLQDLLRRGMSKCITDYETL